MDCYDEYAMDEGYDDAIATNDSSRVLGRVKIRQRLFHFRSKTCFKIIFFFFKKIFLKFKI